MSSPTLLKVESESLLAAIPTQDDRQLLIASRKYAEEYRWKSWLHLISTLLLLAALVAIAGLSSAIWLRSLSSLMIGLTLVRMFILYHDYLHQAIFKGSRAAGAILTLYGHLMLTAPTIWKRSHDHHHKNNSKMLGASIGSFPIMTTSGYQAATLLQRIEYRVSRSPLTILFGYFTVFLFGMCLFPLFCDFKRNTGVFVTLLLHFSLITASVVFFGWATTAFVFLVPTALAMMLGSYLFYIQHNFPAAKIRTNAEWSYTDAALCSSSYLELGTIMRWFTGNIGYHHIHHLNAKIPFYRLPEAMAGLKGLQNPGRTSLKISEIISCLRLKLWDTDRDQLVPFLSGQQVKS